MPDTWIVTGASRGIGAAIAKEAVGAGHRVALVARSDSVEQVAADLRAGGGEAIAIREDVTSGGAAERITAATRIALGPATVLVNNAGLHRGGRIEGLLDGDFESVLSANLIAPFRLTRAFVAEMTTAGAVIMVGAVVGLRGFPGDSAYGSAKAGLAGLTQVLAIELAQRGITVNCVVPGFTETEMTAGVEPRARERLLARIPIGRPCTTVEVARVVCWVAASPGMTGAVIPIDGGLMAALGSAR